jgi:hypothetical protein
LDPPAVRKPQPRQIIRIGNHCGMGSINFGRVDLSVIQNPSLRRAARWQTCASNHGFIL